MWPRHSGLLGRHRLMAIETDMLQGVLKAGCCDYPGAELEQESELHRMCQPSPYKT